jgi:hypothetical protein
MRQRDEFAPFREIMAYHAAQVETPFVTGMIAASAALARLSIQFGNRSLGGLDFLPAHLAEIFMAQNLLRTVACNLYGNRLRTCAFAGRMLNLIAVLFAGRAGARFAGQTRALARAASFPV